MTPEMKARFDDICASLIVTRESERIAFREAMKRSWNLAVEKCAETAMAKHWYSDDNDGTYESSVIPESILKNKIV